MYISTEKGPQVSKFLAYCSKIIFVFQFPLAKLCLIDRDRMLLTTIIILASGMSSCKFALLKTDDTKQK